MEHYICTGGCNGASQTAGVCQAEECPLHNHPLEKCNCQDGQHHGAFDFKHDHEHSLPVEKENPTTTN